MVGFQHLALGLSAATIAAPELSPTTAESGDGMNALLSFAGEDRPDLADGPIRVYYRVRSTYDGGSNYNEPCARPPDGG